MMRIAVVGTSCSGKTTLARRLAAGLGTPHVELDHLFWGPNWTPRPVADFRADVSRITAGRSWVCDGNYSRVRDLVWPRAEVLVWLDYPFRIVLYRAVTRSVRRLVTRESLFAGNRESLQSIFDPDWIPWWVLRTHRGRHREYAKLLREPRFRHLEVRRLRAPRDAEVFLEDVLASTAVDSRVEGELR